jgi:hypothetical protein
LVAVLAGGEFKRQNRPTATLERAMAVSFVDHKELQGSQQKESSVFPVGVIELSPFQHAHEERLREILRLLGWITTAANIGV